MKNTNKKLPLNFTLSDKVYYSGELPECIEDNVTACDVGNRDLTVVLSKVMENLCERNKSILLSDISTLDMRCLLNKNKEISFEDKKNLKNLFEFLSKHLCYIYDKLCEDCMDSYGDNCFLETSEGFIGKSKCTHLRDQQIVIEDHEERIPKLDRDPIQPTVVIPLDLMHNKQEGNSVVYNISNNVLNKKEGYYFSKTINGDRLKMSDNPENFIPGALGFIRVDYNGEFLEYRGYESVNLTGQSTFSIYYTSEDTESESYVFLINIYTINACCNEEVEPVWPCYEITLSGTNWQNSSEFNALTIESVTYSGVPLPTSGYFLSPNKYLHINEDPFFKTPISEYFFYNSSEEITLISEEYQPGVGWGQNMIGSWKTILDLGDTHGEIGDTDKIKIRLCFEELVIDIPPIDIPPINL